MDFIFYRKYEKLAKLFLMLSISPLVILDVNFYGYLNQCYNFHFSFMLSVLFPIQESKRKQSPDSQHQVKRNPFQIRARRYQGHST